MIEILPTIIMWLSNVHVLCGFILSTINLPTRIGSVTQNFGRDDKRQELSSKAEVKSALSRSIHLRNLMQETCNSRKMSCAGRCGDFLNSEKIETWVVTNDVFCSCDVYCIPYDDCCSDFRLQCPEEATRYDQQSRFHRKFVVTCENGAAVVDDPVAIADERASNDTSFDLRPIITFKSAGITFRNVDVYKQYHPDGVQDELGCQHPVESCLAWNKSLNGPFYIGMDIVEKTLESRTSEHGMVIRDERPNVKTRECKHWIKMRCRKRFSPNVDESLLYFSTNSFHSWCSNYSLNGSDIGVRDNEISRNFAVTEKYPNPKTDNGVRCDSLHYIFDSSRNTFFDLKIILSVGVSDNKVQRSVVTSPSQHRWKEFRFDDDAKMVVVCNTGYLYALDDCRRPEMLSIQTLGAYNLTTAMTETFDLLEAARNIASDVIPLDFRHRLSSVNASSYSVVVDIPIDCLTLDCNAIQDRVKKIFGRILKDSQRKLNSFNAVTTCVCFKDRLSSGVILKSCHRFESVTGFAEIYFEMSGSNFIYKQDPKGVATNFAGNRNYCNIIAAGWVLDLYILYLINERN